MHKQANQKQKRLFQQFCLWVQPFSLQCVPALQANNKNKPINHLFVVCCSHTLAYRPGGFSTPAYISKKQKHILHSGYSPSFSLIYHSENQSHVLRSFPIWLLQNWKVFRAYNSLLFSLASRGSQRRYFAAALSKGSRARPPARSGHVIHGPVDLGFEQPAGRIDRLVAAVSTVAVAPATASCRRRVVRLRAWRSSPPSSA